MIGNYWVNVWVSAGAFLLTFLTALKNNVLAVAIERAFYSLIIFFLASYLIRWLLSLVIGAPSSESGNHVDLITPEETEAEMSAAESNRSDHHEPTADSGPSEQFAPLEPPRIERDEQSQPETIANALRRFSDD